MNEQRTVTKRELKQHYQIARTRMAELERIMLDNLAAEEDEPIKVSSEAVFFGRYPKGASDDKMFLINEALDILGGEATKDEILKCLREGGLYAAEDPATVNRKEGLVKQSITRHLEFGMKKLSKDGGGLIAADEIPLRSDGKPDYRAYEGRLRKKGE